ncbi:MAG: cadmium-translocating P-type ATPase [Mesorhizobium sp.]|uniref:cation-translocating P-type ATPase n=1 Tax=unclassified Mesorhizobium TaxID=325217 RepID=UPI000FCC4877|nr:MULTISPECIES: cation-translocating P-type ATPase [unclassified Mesorhizobium]RUV73238.1 cadmium-translocating P-type ATPase [Mesorhizobium sp. M5C.F.Cr.IN.023.01.1.1]RWF86661.1 MAG: cadmium-translocating P-type ATPase [Mesorhizobium sp.]RWF95378.1 MAG: cadmium-translocating P-type ATPase [Mesorhizobium sp.]RWI39784.1 MAG: cadmium-translocating P-type ATPase [Mesorhizobium sp.]RWI45350.1 MAG: cadmium-translocating P-type ATPase [Mesorhizobium sp.]
MSCCAPGSDAANQHTAPSVAELDVAARSLGGGLRQIDLSIPAVHCAACISTVEGGLKKLPGVTLARVNLSTRRVTVQWDETQSPRIGDTLADLGYLPHLFDDSAERDDSALPELIRAVAVSGFAASNIMLLSVSVWSGAEGATRDLFHWVSALIALPALLFAGRIYYRSAWSALRRARMNMDVPIAIGVTLAYAMSLYETINHGHHAYFDAAVSLLFFLLIGRTLDHVMRERARSAVMGLSRLTPHGAVVVAEDGTRSYRPVGEIAPGMRILIAAGERIPVDALVIEGISDLDCSLVNGESNPAKIEPGSEVRAGTQNLTGPIEIEAVRPVSSSFLAEMTRLMEAAEGGRTRYRRIAERVSALYAPVVHLTAFITFLGWMAVNGDWHQAATIAIAVLIITCPCALGLAVPIVQVVAARRLFDAGIMMKDGSALERVVGVDAVAFDKTGTLTLGRPTLRNAASIDPETLAAAAELASRSRHPASQALAAFDSGSDRCGFTDIRELPGLGIEARRNGEVWKLGRATWAVPGAEAVTPGTVLSRNGELIAEFELADTLRGGAEEAIAALRHSGFPVDILSGDTEANCRDVAKRLGIGSWHSELLPPDKLRFIQELTDQGNKVFMIGDGLNDAPALGAARVSMAPASAADIGRNAADFVFLHESLTAVPTTLEVARRADRLIRQNITLAIVYNAIAVPIAILGYVTPLIAAIAMSLSSVLVIANALRLSNGKSTQERSPTLREARIAP